MSRSARRRVWGPWLIAVALLVGAVAVGWFAVLPTYRPRLRAGESYAVDVSAHQGVIDWQRVAQSGVGAAYVKVSEGVTLVDPRARANWFGARAAGLRAGAYQYFTLCSTGRDQARTFLAVLPGPAQMPPVVDLELDGTCAARPPPAAVLTEVAEFRRLVEAGTGQRLAVRVGASFANRYPGVVSLGGERWVRRLLRRPHGPWLAWQASMWARVPGIPGRVDLDVVRS